MNSAGKRDMAGVNREEPRKKPTRNTGTRASQKRHKRGEARKESKNKQRESEAGTAQSGRQSKQKHKEGTRARRNCTVDQDAAKHGDVCLMKYETQRREDSSEEA